MRGIYGLLIHVEKDVSVKVGRLGRMRFWKGIYVYVGSGLGSASTSIEGRVSRHFCVEKKKHWHIDYLLSNHHAKPVAAIYSENRRTSECRLTEEILSENWARMLHNGFGASDCSCQGHLIFLEDLGKSQAEGILWKEFEDLGNRPQRWAGMKY